MRCCLWGHGLAGSPCGKTTVCAFAHLGCGGDTCVGWAGVQECLGGVLAGDVHHCGWLHPRNRCPVPCSWLVHRRCSPKPPAVPVFVQPRTDDTGEARGNSMYATWLGCGVWGVGQSQLLFGLGQLLVLGVGWRGSWTTKSQWSPLLPPPPPTAMSSSQRALNTLSMIGYC